MLIKWKLKAKPYWLASALLCAIGCAASLNIPPAIAQTPLYTWKQAKVGALGFMTGMVVHPTATTLKYVRTDVGGAFRWDSSSQTWTALNDRQKQDGEFGSESIALDANNSNLVYLEGGSSKDGGDVYKSSDKGLNWTALGLRKSDGSKVYVGPNDDWRHVGERLAIDPNNNGQTIYCGTRKDGLFRSTNGGVNWSSVALPNNGTTGIGVTFVVFDKSSGTSSTRSATIYAGVGGAGVYRTTDGGANWQLLTNAPDSSFTPTRAAMGANGAIYVAYQTGSSWTSTTGGAVYRFVNGSGSAVSPASNTAFCGLSVSPGATTGADVIAAASWPFSTMYRSTNGGANWATVNPTWVQSSYLPSWYAQNWIAQVVIDPENTARTWMTNGTGVYRTDNNAGANQTYTMRNDGIEELVSYNVRKVAGGPLHYGVADLTGFSLSNLDAYPTTNWEPGQQGHGTGFDYFQGNSKTIVRTGGTYNGDRFDKTSTDGGANWTSFNAPTGVKWGSLAMSSSNANWLVRIGTGWTTPSYSQDRGATWNTVTLASGQTASAPPSQNWFNDIFVYSQPLVSDRVNGNIFYLYGKDGTFWRSNNGGVAWAQVCPSYPKQIPDNWQYVVKASPDTANDVWISFINSGSDNGLYHSTDGGANWSKVANISECLAFGFGKAAAGQSRSAIYVYGKVTGGSTYGIYRSDDVSSAAGDGSSATWNRINADAQSLPQPVGNGVEGDPEVYGKVYVATAGRGLFYGTVASASSTPSPTPAATPTPSSGSGLKAEYFSDKNLTTLLKTQTDATVNFAWGNGAPKNSDGSAMSGIGVDNFSVRWSGQVQAIEAGTYTFTTTTDDGVRLFLNGTTTPQINKWDVQSPTSYTATIDLTAGQKIAIKMEYFEQSGGASAKLSWTRPGKTSVVIPQSQLFPNAATTNLIVNASFEAEDSDTATPSGWDVSGDSNAFYTETNGGAASGARHGTHWRATQYAVYTSQTKTGLANGLYTLRCQGRSGGGQWNCHLEAKDFGGTARTADLPVSSSYQNVEIKDINVTNNTCTVGIWSNAWNGYWCYFDDFEFFKQ